MGTRTNLAGAEPVCASIELLDEMSGPVWAGHVESQRRSPPVGAHLREGQQTPRPEGGSLPLAEVSLLGDIPSASVGED